MNEPACEPLFLPVLHSFENNNIFSGSFGRMRFRVTPDITMKTPKEVDNDQSSMKAEVWHGEYCYEKSEIEDTRVFPLSPEGLEQMRAWLTEHVEQA